MMEGSRISVDTTHDGQHCFTLDEECWRCYGTGKDSQDGPACDTCHGTGYITTEQGDVLLAFIKRHTA